MCVCVHLADDACYNKSTGVFNMTGTLYLSPHSNVTEREVHVYLILIPISGSSSPLSIVIERV